MLNDAKPCRKCGEALLWDAKKKRRKECRNGCSQITANIPADAESVMTSGTNGIGQTVRGNCMRRGRIDGGER